ncbi:hypothetical protein NSQ20_12175 [Paenibacillus sp. FSL K6-1122]|uniref:hypothetical protein n=1 Tax=Paenibacillus sp. FSL K6-1122 TaxID=2954512 RepID=UPI0030EF78BC
MGTRIWYEVSMTSAFEEIRFVRMYYNATNKTAVAYVSNANNELPENLKTRVEEFLRNQGSAHLLHKVKPYSEIEADQVSFLADPPLEIKRLALLGSLNQSGIKKSLSLAFPFLDMELTNFENGVLKIWISNQDSLSQMECQIIRDYSNEIVPLGVTVEFI